MGQVSPLASIIYEVQYKGFSLLVQLLNSLDRILNGTVNPSGRTADTYVKDLTQTPTWNNFGFAIYDNMDEFRIAGNDPYVPGTRPHYVHYVEDIYVGYKYYETAAAEGFIDYDSIVQYPFGHGLSYTSFTQEMGPISERNGTITFDVTVTNTGSVAGKDVVEVYYNPPYTNGGIEKASANLNDAIYITTNQPAMARKYCSVVGSHSRLPVLRCKLGSPLLHKHDPLIHCCRCSLLFPAVQQHERNHGHFLRTA